MEKKIKENWKAIEEAEKQAKNKTGDPEAAFNADLFFMNNDGRHLVIPIKYRRKKGKKGQETWTESYKEINVFAKFCPFTGKPLYETEQEAEKG